MRPHSIRTAAFCALLSLACACSAHAESMSIGSIHCNDADGMPLTKGKPVSFTGIVTGQFSTDVNVKLYIQDATGGVNVYGTPKNCVALGDSVRVSGVVAGFRGLTEITGTDEAPLAVELLGHATLAPTPLALTIEQVLATGDKSGCEPNESRLIQLNDVRILSGHGEALPDTAIFADGTYVLVSAPTKR